MNQQQSSSNSRLMQVKVLYTFNDDNKFNCLARCPQPLQIQTASLDASTEIGIIELRTCIQSIVSASPELVAKLGQDYTIYAYDYSEYETPLVGQGMLSWVLASSSSTPNASADQSRTMVTGRVCKNVFALFSEGAKETLEVKLRLVPVPTCLQSEYLASMEKYRQTTTVASENLDTAAWSTFLHANPNFGAVDHALEPISYHAPQPQRVNSTGLADFPSHFDPNFHNIEVPVSALRQQPTGQALRGIAPSSRPATPSESKSQTQRKTNPSSRPSSRASGRGRPSVKKAASCASRVEMNSQTADTSEAEEGPSRKRARVIQTDWNGASVFVNSAESLRVAAASAASIRGNRPSTASHPSTADIAAGETGERPPTPIPHSFKPLVPVAIPRYTTSLARGAIINEPTPRSSAETPADHTRWYQSSPEKRDESTGSTPFEFPSSPPVMQRPSPTPSSPQLPFLPGHQDSGFVSGALDEDPFEDDDKAPHIENAHHTQQETSGLKLESMSSTLNVEQYAPSGDVAPEEPQANTEKSRKRKQPAKSRPSNTSRAASSKRATPAQSPINPQPSSDNSKADGDDTCADAVGGSLEGDKNEPPSAENQSATYLAQQCSESCAIDAETRGNSPEPAKPFKSRQNSVMHEKKKQAIRDNLAQAIKAGQMPRFCKNCGAISTPTWRLVFVKVSQGPPQNLDLADSENGTLMWEPVETDEQGNITSHRIIKKTIDSEEEGFESLDLCNSCGVWLFKYKSMRPREIFEANNQPKAPPKRSHRKKANKKEEQGAPTPHAQSEVNEEPQSQIDLAPVIEIHYCETDSTGGGSKEMPRIERANSVGLAEVPTLTASLLEKSSAAAALRRAIQSSPPGFPGSKFSPIEIEVEKASPRPTRRMLFPSPRKPGEVKSLEDPIDSEDILSKESLAAAADRAGRGKDNDTSEDDGLDDLFEKDDSAKSTDSSKSKLTPRNPPQTPRKSDGDGSTRKNGHLTSAAKRWRTSSPGTPLRGGEDNHFTLGLEQMTPFTRQLTQLISEANQASEDNDPTFDPMNPHIDVPGFFTFSDFSAEDFAVAGAGDGENGGSMLHDQIPPSEAYWEEDGNLSIDSAIDAFLETDEMEQESSVPPKEALLIRHS